MNKAQIGPEKTQTLEVLGTRNLLNVLRTQLEAEGVGVATTKTDPPKPVIIEPVQERIAYDIAIPLTKPQLVHDIRRFSGFDPAALDPIFEQEDPAEVYRVRLKLEFPNDRDGSPPSRHFSGCGPGTGAARLHHEPDY